MIRPSMYSVQIEHKYTAKEETLGLYNSAAEARKAAEDVAALYPRVRVLTYDGYLLEEYVSGKRQSHMG